MTPVQNAGPVPIQSQRMSPTQVQTASDRDQKLMSAAKELEASFLAEMLKEAGLGKMPEAFGGGAGEEQFSSFLRQEQARGMVEAGGIGLAQTLFEAMKERADGTL